MKNFFIILYLSCCLACNANEKALSQLEQNISASQLISKKADRMGTGEEERLLLASYQALDIPPIPLLVTTTVWEDGFGDYVSLQHVLTTLIELGFKDIEVVVCHAACHRDKLLSHPLPKAEGISSHFIEFERNETHCTVKEQGMCKTVSKEELPLLISKSTLFDSYKEGKRELLVVATFFSEAFKQFKELKGRYPIYLREISPYLKNAILQNLFALGWARNQAMPVDRELLKMKQLTTIEKSQLALQLFPKHLLKIMCDNEVSADNLEKYWQTHALHHAYFHNPVSDIAFSLISLQADARLKHDFFSKNCKAVYTFFSALFKNQFKSPALVALLIDTLKIGEIEFCFLNGERKVLQLGEAKKVRFIETEFMPAKSYQLLISLISAPFIEGCTGDHSAQQALLLGHLPLIEHTASKDFPQDNRLETHFCQNTVSLFHALVQQKPYPEHLSSILYISDLLMFHLRQQGLAALQDPEVLLLMHALGKKLQDRSYREELDQFSSFLAKERDLKPFLSSILKRQTLLKQNAEKLLSSEKEALKHDAA